MGNSGIKMESERRHRSTERLIHPLNLKPDGQTGYASVESDSGNEADVEEGHPVHLQNEVLKTPERRLLNPKDDIDHFRRHSDLGHGYSFRNPDGGYAPLKGLKRSKTSVSNPFRAPYYGTSAGNGEVEDLKRHALEEKIDFYRRTIEVQERTLRAQERVLEVQKRCLEAQEKVLDLQKQCFLSTHVAIGFRIFTDEKNSRFGVIGNLGALGYWAEPIPLTPTPNNSKFRCATVILPADAKFQWKFIKWKSDGEGFVFEEGPNRMGDAETWADNNFVWRSNYNY